jgi:hypothetical protein
MKGSPARKGSPTRKGTPGKKGSPARKGSLNQRRDPSDTPQLSLMQFDGKPRAVMDLLQGGLDTVSGQTPDSVTYPHYSHEEYHFDTHAPHSEEYHDTHDFDYEDAYDFHPYDYEHHQDG